MTDAYWQSINPRPHLGGCQPQTVFLGCKPHFFDRRLIFCVAYFLTFLHKVCKWQSSMTFQSWAMNLFSRSCQGPFEANVHCCGSFQFFLTSMINLAIRDGSNAYGNESSATSERWTPYRSYDIIAGHHENICVKNSLQNRGRAVGEVSLFCLPKTHRLICKMAYLGHYQVSSYDLT